MKFSLGFFCHVPQIPEVHFLGSRCLGIFRPNSAPRDRVWQFLETERSESLYLHRCCDPPDNRP